MAGIETYAHLRNFLDLYANDDGEIQRTPEEIARAAVFAGQVDKDHEYVEIEADEPEGSYELRLENVWGETIAVLPRFGARSSFEWVPGMRGTVLEVARVRGRYVEAGE